MIVVTGAGGFIGSYLVEKLIELGEEQILPLDIDQGDCPIPITYCDIRSPETFPLTKHVDVVIHCAALLMIDGHAPYKYFEVNTIGTYNILEFARRTGARLIYTMTHSDVNMSDELYIREETPQKYGGSPEVITFVSSKIAAMNMIQAYNAMGYVHSIILRLANIRGYGSQDTKYGCVFHQFIEKTKQGISIELWGKLKTKRDLIYIKDVIRAIIAAINPNVPAGLYNIGSGRGLTIKDEAEAIVQVFSPPGMPFAAFIYRPDIPEVRKRSCIFDINKAISFLGWRPKYDYLEGLMDMKRIMEEDEK